MEITECKYSNFVCFILRSNTITWDEKKRSLREDNETISSQKFEMSENKLLPDRPTGKAGLVLKREFCMETVLRFTSG